MDLMALDGIRVDQRLELDSLELCSGEVLGLIGPNGAGKTTLLNAIAGALDYSGRITLDGQDFLSLSQNERARKVALQPQAVELAWSLCVHDVVSMGRLPWGDNDQQVIHQVMRDTAVEEMAARPIDHLSGGEQARVWLARALSNQPDLLLVDEPVANLDLHYQLQVMKILRDYVNTTRGVIIALHDLGLAARFCDRLCLMHGGRIIRSGTVADVLQPKLLNEVYGVEIIVDLEREPPIVVGA